MKKERFIHMFTFKNVGKELCFWARFFLTVLTIIWMLSVCLGAVALYFLLDESGMGEMIPGGAIILPVVGGILTFLLGYLVIRFSTIKLYAQGKMVDHLASIDRKMDELKNAMPSMDSVQNPYAGPVVATVVKEAPVKEAEKAPVVEAPVEEPAKKGFCMNCGALNSEDSMFCTNCGTPLN